MNGKTRLLCLILSMALVAGQLTGCAGASAKDKAENDAAETVKDEGVSGTGKDAESEETVKSEQSKEIARVYGKHMLDGLFAGQGRKDGKAFDPSITVRPNEDLSNVSNIDDFFYMNDKAKEELFRNGFIVSGYDTGDEFFETYEFNRYSLSPNFITVDSMMHTYHLYFSHLLKDTEKNFLSDELYKLSTDMLDASEGQYEELKGSDWEDAAVRNVAYFAVGARLLDPDTKTPSYVRDTVESELSLVNNAAGITRSSLLGGELMEDYSQYKPRGYYEGDEKLERYFRAMMWYGRINFEADEERLLRSAVLMNLALDGGPLDEWEKIYSVTSFFAGESDDLSYYDLLPAIEAAFGKGTGLLDMAGDKDGFTEFTALVKDMKGPMIMSVPVWASDDNEDKTAESKGYRFMGQRFSVDGAIFNRLVYSNTGKDDKGNVRRLPDALDVAAALGSDEALGFLDEQGDTAYDGYKENMAELKENIAAAPDSFWEGSLALAWVRTMMPLLNEKDSSYPFFMTTDAWVARSIEGFLSSWTELKHDTVLYGKQNYAEMGGGDIEEKDDRGYVEPETEIYSGLKKLIDKTGDGLSDLDCISDSDRENLKLLSDLAGSLAQISEKELNGEKITDDEYELIRSYGGSLEHFWADAVKNEDGSEYLHANEYPCALVTDVASDPNGNVLECGTGGCATIYALVPVDGELRIAIGSVFSFYEFNWPSSDRLTDTEWREGMGIEPVFSSQGEFISFEKHLDIDKPWWTEGYIGSLY